MAFSLYHSKALPQQALIAKSTNTNDGKYVFHIFLAVSLSHI